MGRSSLQLKSVGITLRVTFDLRSVLAALAGVTLLTGCQPTGPALYPVAGTVTLDGQPLAQGFISLDPADGKGSAYAGEIIDGKFTLESEPGKKSVSIRASRHSKKPGPDGGPDFEQFLPARYNTQTTLTTTIEPRLDNRADFELTIGNR